jgi:hypothetical protein
MATTNPIPRDTDQASSSGVEARKLLALRSTPKTAPAKSRASNGNTSVGGKAVSGGARTRGGRA